MNTVSPLSILIVDDVPANIQVLAETLREEYQLKVATNGADALAIVAKTPPDIILLDVMMPEMDGFEVCRRLKTEAATQNIPIIFITAKDDFGDEERGLNLGAADYITKPFHLPVVRARVRNQLQLKRKADLLEQLAHIDSLTGISNRRRFDETLEREFRRCRRAEKPLSLLMIDVDQFKRYNDHFGHGMGDICLSHVATALTHSLPRAADTAARYGGEEFSVILPETDAEGAMQTAVRLCEKIVSLNITHAPGINPPVISISIGVATSSAKTETPLDLITAADLKLYEAKNSGRNRACG